MLSLCSHIPTKLYFGCGCVTAHREELCSLGSKALIVTGRSSANNGSLDDVKAALDSCGKEYAVFDKTEENPSVATVMEAARLAVSNGADFVIGIGGGSPLDAAKAAALMAANPDKGEAFLTGKEKCQYTPALPTAAIPTTCGTGSEVTGVSVLTYHERRTKGSIPFRIYPAIALCDGSYLINAPRSLIINTAVDTLGHLIESYLNSAADDHSKAIAAHGLELWKRDLPLLERGITAEEGSMLLEASAAGGAAIAHTGTGIPHGLSYTLTYEQHIHHGKAVGYFLPAYVRLCPDADRREVLRLTGFDSEEAMARYIYSMCGCAPIDRSLAALSAETFMKKPEKLLTAPFAADSDAVSEIAFSACDIV